MSTRWRRSTASRPHAVEAATLALVFLFTLSGVWMTHALLDEPVPLWPGIALSALACAALLWRRSHPLPVLAVTALCIMAEGALGYLMTPLLMGPVMTAQYVASLRTDRKTTWNSALAAAVGIALTGLFHNAFRDPVLSAVNPAAWLLMVAAFGSYVRVRREYAAARAEHTAREREEEARRRVVQERMRIAGELHDVVAHHLTLANAQAGTAVHLSRTNPDQAFEIVGQLWETTTMALRELKATVGLLHQDTDPDDELAPAPGLGQLDDLVAACSAAGLDVAVTVDGEPRPLTGALDLTVYRIVQEALTNVTKHAATRTARVRLAYTPRCLTLDVTNETSSSLPRASNKPAGGYGLLGMRERARSVGGTFRAGPRPGGRFEVTCAFPLHSPDESSAT
ncbi:sensor histidine kinase [Streptomyces sp. NPDC048751]|uniref:sensor histidine kinase n=1 Tax=Streptomyces sp. NPDC048751 TaxID=3365591 RepID=UPI0037187AC5